MYKRKREKEGEKKEEKTQPRGFPTSHASTREEEISPHMMLSDLCDRDDGGAPRGKVYVIWGPRANDGLAKPAAVGRIDEITTVKEERSMGKSDLPS